MNEEIRRQWIACSKVFVALVIACMWGFAGVGVEITRKFVLPLILACVCMAYDYLQRKDNGYELIFGLMIKNRHVRLIKYALMFPLYYCAMAIFAYGAGSWLRPLVGKFFQRVIVGFMWALPAGMIAWASESKWPVYLLHVVGFTVVMCTIGGLNLVEARSEETIIGFVWAFLPLFMVKYD